MNQEKVGKFIAKCRKEKEMTQQELADRLGITDKAVSKWENGRCMPDISFLEPLSTILEVEISEILKGERIKENLEEISSAVEDVVSSVNNHNQEKRKKVNNWLKTALILYAIFGINNHFHFLDFIDGNIQEFVNGILIGGVLYCYLRAYLENNKYRYRIINLKKKLLGKY